MHNTVAIAIMAVALAVVTAPMVAAEAPDAPHLKTLLTSEQFKKMGLNKLTSDEINALQDWIQLYSSLTASLPEKPNQQPIAPRHNPSMSTPEVIESTISGDFNGWDGETIFKLDNGQIWEQAEYDYNYEYSYRPEVTIYHTSQGYRMRVEDVEETILVRRIK